jgi:WD40 repeat protein
VAVTPDGRRAVSASDDGTPKKWELQSSRELRILESPAGWVNAVAVTPDGRRAVYPHVGPVTASRSGSPLLRSQQAASGRSKPTVVFACPPQWRFI